ncbi:4-hydroxy-3-methylbut-2-enyl diphosphate reductase [Streptomyces monticola]|uniref:4-hydroxy-3-methylbut-2-enyl diphosphate reductase n=1 Tax=Streptomyces monticola TaxID=2666263 RepID=A0ABW2JLU7_9ACTN
MSDDTKLVLLAEPRGFCAGVDRAIGVVEALLARHGPPVYVRKQIVHNHDVVRRLESRGARFVDSVQEVPRGMLCVLSAHGVAPSVRERAAERGLRVIDATCPLVAKVHQEARRFAARGRHILLIGHAAHEEVEGTAGQAPELTTVVESPEALEPLLNSGDSALTADTPVAWLTQTTLSPEDTGPVLDAVRERFRDVRGPASEDICYASLNRQNGVRRLAVRCDAVLVVGSENSSNARRMVEVARTCGAPAHLVPDAGHLDERWLHHVSVVGVSSGASTPESLVDELLARLRALGYGRTEHVAVAEESVAFALPPLRSTGDTP